MGGFIAGRHPQIDERPGALATAFALLLAIAAGLTANLANAAQPAGNVPPQASGTELSAIEAERTALFKKMLSDPGNVKLALRYAELSSQAGDLEGAISTLERLLIFAPDVAQLNYELGLLYMRLGAYGQASADFKAAAAAPDATPEIKAAAAKYVAMADQQAQGDFTTGSVALGARYQTNANGGAQNALVTLNGIQFQLSPSAMAEPDANAFIAGSLHSSHDLETQGDRFDFNANFYGSLYKKRGDLNTLAGEVMLGPVFDFERFSIHNTTLGVYAIGNAVGLQGALYQYTIGLGANLSSRVTQTTSLGSRFEYRYETYVNSAARPNVATMTGPRMRLTESTQTLLNDRLKLYGAAYGERKTGQTGIQSDWEGGGSVGVQIALGELSSAPATLDLSGGLARRLFDAADPIVSTAPRLDTNAFIQASLSLPLPKGFSVTATTTYSKQVSTYDLYTFDNVSASASLTKSF